MGLATTNCYRRPALRSPKLSESQRAPRAYGLKKRLIRAGWMIYCSVRPIPDHCPFYSLCLMHYTRPAESAGSLPLPHTGHLAASKVQLHVVPTK